MIKDDLNLFENSDVYSMSMFILYKLTEDPEYTAVSELPYILDKKNMLSLCTYFGGHTIKIPTVEELYSIMHVILLYQKIHVDKVSFDEAIKLVGYGDQDLRKVKHIYSKLVKVLDKYEFKHRAKN